MTIQKLASLVAKREALKVSIGVAQVREVLRILVDLEVESGLGPDAPSFIIGDAADRKLKRKKKTK